MQKNRFIKIISKENLNSILILGFIATLEIIATFYLPKVKGDFFGYLSTFNKSCFDSLLILMFVMCYIELAQAIKNFFVTKSVIQIRPRISKYFLKNINKVDTWPQRVQEDIKIYLRNIVFVYSEYYIAIGTAISLILINIKNYELVIGSLILSAIIIFINNCFSKKMKYAESVIQQNEADYRNDLRINNSLKLLDTVLLYNSKSNLITLKYNTFSRIANFVVAILPYLILLPEYFKHKIGLGEFIQNSSTFTLLVINITVIINLYQPLIQAYVSRDRLLEILKCQK